MLQQVIIVDVFVRDLVSARQKTRRYYVQV